MTVWRAVLITSGMAALLSLALALDPASLYGAAEYAWYYPVGLLGAFAAYTASFGLRALSWRQLLRERISLRRLFALIMGALFLNHVAPAKAGDLARMYALTRWGVTGERAVTSVVLSRLVDLVGLLMVLAVSWTLAGAGGWERLAYPALVVAGVVAALPVLYRLEVPARFGAVSRYVDRLREALRETTWAALSWSLAFAALAWVLEAGILLFVVRGVGVELSLAGVVAATCFAVLAAAVPLTPGSLGTYEAGMVAIMLAFGVAAEPAFAIAVTTHAVKFLYAFAGAPFVASLWVASLRGVGKNKSRYHSGDSGQGELGKGHVWAESWRFRAPGFTWKGLGDSRPPIAEGREPGVEKNATPDLLLHQHSGECSSRDFGEDRTASHPRIESHEPESTKTRLPGAKRP